MPPYAMADEQLTSERQITGDDIIAELLRNCNAGAFKIRYTTILPCLYNVYLHQSDYDLIRPVLPALIAEARSALIDRLDELARKSRPSAIARTLGFAPERQTEYKILDPDWTIEFHPDAEDKLKRGDIEIYSELASAQRPEFDGAMTRHVTKRRGDGQISSVRLPADVSPAVATSTAPPQPVPVASTTAGPAPTAAAQTVATPSGSATAPTLPINPAAVPVAYLHYEDPGSGRQTFPMLRNQLVIGRGGKSFWVDLKLSGPPDVSREHCRIRRDPETGQFLIKDLSHFGTAVDGRRLPSSIEDRDGQQRDKNVEVPLPERCRLTLADVLIIEFEAVQE